MAPTNPRCCTDWRCSAPPGQRATERTTPIPNAKITVLRREVFENLQEQYLADPRSGSCDMFYDGQEFLSTRNSFWHMLGGQFCAEAWDAISRYVYAALQGGSIMRGCTNDEKMMIPCCNDRTRPVIFKIERIDEEQHS